MISESIRQDHSSYIKDKTLERERINREVGVFLSSGGEIQQIPTGYCAYDWAGNKQKHWWQPSRTVAEVDARAKRRQHG